MEMQRLNEYFLTLDIETSTEYEDVVKDGIKTKKPIAVWLSYGFSVLWDRHGKPVKGCYFRDWIKLQKFYDRISSKFYYYEIICYVHNLGYEFDYIMKNVSLPQKFLSNNTHNVIAGTLKRYKNIEFRCSYMLSSYSLRKIGEMVNLPKLESDYRTIFPDDSVTPKEIIYCYRDNEIVAKYITKIMLPEYGTIHNIPYTKTGRVRKKFNENYSNYTNHNWDLMPPENCYNALNKAFNGGITISNPLFTNINLENVHSYDITSSYPFAMISEKFPQKIKKVSPPKKIDLQNYFIAKIKFINISSIYAWQWLSISKMENISDDCEFFNGKLIRGAFCERYVTNIDFEIISKTYDFEYEIVEYYELFQIEYLPECFIDTITYYADKKHTLKELLKTIEEGTDYFYEVSNEYTKAKNDFNSLYGMMVEKLVKPIYEIDENYIWKRKEGVYIYKENTHLKRNFLFGVFITAYARRNLINAILKNCPHSFVYADTDSIKFIGPNIFVDTNKILNSRFLEIDCLKKLGRFDYEGTYKEFKTLGAKKYCYSHEYKDKPGIYYTLTVAGLPKNDKYDIQSLDDFKIGKQFKNCKLGKKYITNTSYIEIDDSYNIIIENTDRIKNFFDEYKIDSAGGIGLFPTSYLLDMTKNDIYYCKMYQRGAEIWLKKYKQQTGIDLTEYCHINVHTI